MLDRGDQPKPEQRSVKSPCGTPGSENFLRVLESRNRGTPDEPILPLNPKPADYQGGRGRSERMERHQVPDFPSA